MSKELGQIYDRAFFAPYSAASESYSRACHLIASELAERLCPSSAVDWGCGAGLHVRGLLDHGVEALGVDGVVLDEDLRAPGVVIHRADIREPVFGPVPKNYDLSLCLDVLEHVEDTESTGVLGNVIRGAEVVVLSCAPPTQGGHHHVNERPRRYWIKRMAELGWYYQRKETGAMEIRFRTELSSEIPLSWMYHNLCIYRRLKPKGW